MKIQLSKWGLVEVRDLLDARSRWTHYRDIHDLGASQCERGDGDVFGADGKKFAHVSYNGRVWDLDDNEIDPVRVGTFVHLRDSQITEIKGELVDLFGNIYEASPHIQARIRHEIVLAFTRLRRSGARQELTKQIDTQAALSVEADRMLADGWLVKGRATKDSVRAGNSLCYFLTDAAKVYLESLGYWRDRYGWCSPTSAKTPGPEERALHAKRARKVADSNPVPRTGVLL